MKNNKTWFVMSDNPKKIKLRGKKEICFSEKFAEKFILEYTKKGDVVFDPFAGFGTALFAAHKNKRIGIGIEYNKARFDYINSRIKLPSYVINGDSRKLGSVGFRKMDFLLTSPPYMRYFDKEDPFTDYTKSGSYKNYLADIGKVFSQAKKIMKKGSFIVVEVSNTFGKNLPMTPLSWEIGMKISKYFFLEKDIIYCHKEKPTIRENPNHSYCLIFRNN